MPQAAIANMIKHRYSVLSAAIWLIPIFCPRFERRSVLRCGSRVLSKGDLSARKYRPNRHKNIIHLFTVIVKGFGK